MAENKTPVCSKCGRDLCTWCRSFTDPELCGGCRGCSDSDHIRNVRPVRSVKVMDGYRLMGSNGAGLYTGCTNKEMMDAIVSALNEVVPNHARITDLKAENKRLESKLSLVLSDCESERSHDKAEVATLREALDKITRCGVNDTEHATWPSTVAKIQEIARTALESTTDTPAPLDVEKVSEQIWQLIPEWVSIWNDEHKTFDSRYKEEVAIGDVIRAALKEGK